MITLKRVNNITEGTRLEQFEALYTALNHYVRKTLFWLVGREHANDLLQEVFIKVWNNLDKFRQESSIKTWVYRITVNVAHDHMRKNKNSLKEVADYTVEDIQSGSSIETELMNKKIIRRGILALPPKQRVVFVLFYQQDLSLEDIAKALSLPEGTVKSRLHNARDLFKESLRKNGVTYE